MVEKKAFVLFGAPGSGKGTQGEIFEKRTGFRKYVMSTLIREELKDNVELNEKVINQGVLLNDEEALKIFEKRFQDEEKIILDGIPRTEVQAKWVYDFLDEKGYEIILVYVKVDESKLLERIILRAEKEGRKDDSPEIFKKRLGIFSESRDSVLNVFRGHIVEINGDLNIEEVSDDIKRRLGV